MQTTQQPTRQAAPIFGRLLWKLETGAPVNFGRDTFRLIEKSETIIERTHKYYFLERTDRKARDSWSTFGAPDFSQIVKRFEEIYYTAKYNVRP